MNLWIISSSYPRNPGEAENAGVLARDLALRYLDAGHEVRVVTPAKPGGVTFDPGLNGTTIPWFRPWVATADLRPRRMMDALRTVSLVVTGIVVSLSVALRAKPDHVVALWALPSGIFAWVLRRVLRVPYTVWALGSDIWRAPDFPAGKRLLLWILGSAEKAYADGITLAKEAESLSGASVEFLPSVRTLPDPGPRSFKDCDIAFVGRLHPNKGPDVLVGAMTYLETEQCLMFGSGEMDSALNDMILQESIQSNVRLAGPIHAVDVASLLRDCRVLAIPSRIDSLPLILGDSIQAGTTVVVTDVGDMGEVVRQFGLGLVVPPDEPRHLAEAIREALDGAVPVRRDTEAKAMFSLGRASEMLMARTGGDTIMAVDE